MQNGLVRLFLGLSNSQCDFGFVSHRLANIFALRDSVKTKHL